MTRLWIDVAYGVGDVEAAAISMSDIVRQTAASVEEKKKERIRMLL